MRKLRKVRVGVRLTRQRPLREVGRRRWRLGPVLLHEHADRRRRRVLVELIGVALPALPAVALCAVARPRLGAVRDAVARRVVVAALGTLRGAEAVDGVLVDLDTARAVEAVRVRVLSVARRHRLLGLRCFIELRAADAELRPQSQPVQGPVLGEGPERRFLAALLERVVRHIPPSACWPQRLRR